MRTLISAVLLVLAVSVAQAADNGLIVKSSPHSVGATLDRLEQVLTKKGIRLFARVDHSANAKGAGLELRPTQLLIFGNPKLGTPLMNSNQTVGIDLPMKALAWQDADGKVWLGYNDPQYMATRHGIADRAEVVKKMQGALNKMTDAAIAP